MLIDKKNGRLETELKKPIQDVAVGGKMEAVEKIVFLEPVHEAEAVCLRLIQFIRAFAFGSMAIVKKVRDGIEKEELPEVEGEKLVEEHKKEEPKPEELDEEAKGFVQMIINSGIDVEEFLFSARILFTRTFKSRERTNLCYLKFEEKEVEMTPELWEKMSIADKLYLTCLYYSFFDISSIGQR